MTGSSSSVRLTEAAASSVSFALPEALVRVSLLVPAVSSFVSSTTSLRAGMGVTSVSAVCSPDVVLMLLPGALQAVNANRAMTTIICHFVDIMSNNLINCPYMAVKQQNQGSLIHSFSRYV